MGHPNSAETKYYAEKTVPAPLARKVPDDPVARKATIEEVFGKPEPAPSVTPVDPTDDGLPDPDKFDEFVFGKDGPVVDD